ncbi:MFS transporter [Streptomyces capitiformicae]|uniref:MFS transporter n=1 Tax=Streptomyces capitiformicae TaxID=2014920 RepID=A0A918ZMB2_9ACTN|nr:MFS transporter [Streptomyces capitiformicae]GHE57524.1 MFS transporter [Streptomyces capitiformicae]
MSTSPAAPEQAPRAGARQWFGLWVLLFPVALMTVDLGVLWLATPSMTADLQPSSSQLLWTTDIYGFMTCGFLIVMGTLGDRLGRRKLLVLGSLGVIAASLLAAYSTGPEMLIVARALLGVAGAAVLPSTLSLISHMFTDAKQRATAIAMWVTALSAGIAIGPVIGGVLLEHWWWGSVFLVGVPVMVLALPAILLLVPEYRDPNPGRFDLVSVAFFLLGILPVVYGIKKFAEVGWSATYLAAMAVGVVFSVLFVRRQRTLEAPLLDMRLFGDRVFTGALLTLLLGMMALNGVEYLVPPFLLVVGELSPLAAGLWLLPSAIGLIVGSQLTPVLARRIRPAFVIAGGTVITLVGFWLTAVAPADESGVAPSAIGLTIIMFGVAPISVLGTSLAVGAAPPEKAGAAAGAGQTAYDLGLALGIAITGSVAVAVYRNEVADTVPAGVPADAAEAARDTVGGATAAAEELPGALGDQLLTVARDAFTTGFHGTALVSAGFALVATVIVLTLLRHIPAIGSDASQESDTVPEEHSAVASPIEEPTALHKPETVN